MLSLDAIRRRLAQHEARTEQVRDSTFEASVALVLREARGGVPELLFIERAEREGDPWSGHMAFPGGRREAGDGTLAHTAVRETHEEVGLRLGEHIGRLDDVSGSRGGRVPHLVVGAFVFALEDPARLETNEEVRSTVWVPLDWIVSPDSTTSFVLDQDGARVHRPAFRYERYVVWGLTYRILGGFFELLGAPLSEATLSERPVSDERRGVSEK